MKRHIRTDVPNLAQRVPLRLVHPSPENCRLFVEKESLTKLRQRYATHRERRVQILPDAPILRMASEGKLDHSCSVCEHTGIDVCPNNTDPPTFEILAGERRITAATLEGLDSLPCRIVAMTDEEAYRFILDHNAVAGLTVVELAFRAAEMDRLGFSPDQISEAIGGASINRYLTVGCMVNPDAFTDSQKLCDPSIVEWYEAATYGPEHFAFCFRAWDMGAWDQRECASRFRKRGEVLPLDNAERGFRITCDLNRLVVRGQLDLDVVEDAEVALSMLNELSRQINDAREMLLGEGHFGFRMVFHVNPTTV